MKGMTRRQKKRALMDFYGLSAREAKAELEDMGEW